MNPQVAPDHYAGSSYDSKERFISYWYQINEIFLLQPSRLLEIGIGNRFVSRYLKDHNQDITTLDIDYRLMPDVVGSVLSIPFRDKYFDTVTCCEILEHLPYSEFLNSLREINRVTKKHVILSLPDITTVYRFLIELPRFRTIKKSIQHPFHRSAEHIFDGQHYWEIGKTGFSYKNILLDIYKADFRILKTYRIWEFMYHRFFILSKINN
ncbi:MAG: methyltransferase domain-containing protein [Pseudomonadota bacterium]